MIRKDELRRMGQTLHTAVLGSDVVTFHLLTADVN